MIRKGPYPGLFCVRVWRREYRRRMIFNSAIKLSVLPLCLLLTQPLRAGQFEDGLAARERGDYAQALALWGELARQQHAAAMYSLGLMHAEGQGIARNDAEALKWYRRAVTKRYAPAQYAMARLYEQGRGVPKSQSSAMKWYRLAGQQGHIAAQLALGLIYDEGRGVPQNGWQAEKWYRLAAEKGDATAQMNLGLLYSQGRGVPRDYVQAYMWLSLASATGHANADKQRDTISEQMTSEQLAEAEKLASAWSQVIALAKARCRSANLPPSSC